MRRLMLRVAIVLLACLLQFHQLARDLRFHPDEAWFMTFARAAAVNGEWLLPGDLDKPPLSIYTSALSMVAVGTHADDAGVLHLDPLRGEFAGRLPNALLAILLTGLLMRLAGQIYGSESRALFAGLLTATSPFVLAYGASAFTDMSMIFWSTAALYGAVTKRWSLVGSALGLALWGKQQVLFFVPLLILLIAVRRAAPRDLLRAVLPLALLAGALLLWDGARPETSIFLQAAANNAPDQWLVAPSQWLSRLVELASLGARLLGPPLVTIVLLTLSVIVRLVCRFKAEIERSALERAFLLWIIGYLFLHAVFSVNLYDRYLLLLLPTLVVLIAGCLATLVTLTAHGRALQAAALMLITLGAVWTLTAGSAIGADRSQYKGIDELAAYLNEKPVATVIYDPWLGWQLGYYLGQWHDKRRVHYPTAEALIADALALDEVGDRYLVAPANLPNGDWLAALEEAGFNITLDYERDRFLGWRLTPPAAP